MFDEAGGEVDYGSGSIAMVKDGSTLMGEPAGQIARKFDNMTVGEDGKVYIQEDGGNSAYISKTWMFDPLTNSWTQILESDRRRFLAPAAPFNHDEESSGIIEITSILKTERRTALLPQHHAGTLRHSRRTCPGRPALPDQRSTEP